jgi:hypothetical protein
MRIAHHGILQSTEQMPEMRATTPRGRLRPPGWAGARGLPQRGEPQPAARPTYAMPQMLPTQRAMPAEHAAHTPHTHHTLTHTTHTHTHTQDSDSEVRTPPPPGPNLRPPPPLPGRRRHTQHWGCRATGPHIPTTTCTAEEWRRSLSLGAWPLSLSHTHRGTTHTPPPPRALTAEQRLRVSLIEPRAAARSRALLNIYL